MNAVKGTGLGLYIVRSVAKRHKGRVWAESEGPGRGSTFVLQLPLAK
jgi:signal transduction histidine kinase